ncbi:MAG: hypothetical protein JW939_02270 [Candidatus Thermoplasmatota archaeon]|nr:hypothetical protein [Candidatus Thermoplasmatota archaeon]
MDQDKNGMDASSGLSGDTPLGSRIGGVKVAVRPPDPILMERLSKNLRDLASKGVKVPDGSSLAVRSIDGFYYFRDLMASSRDPASGVVSIVNYDPVRRTFILSGNGEVDERCELFWFAFEAFREDHVLFHSSGDLYPDSRPELLEERISFNIGILQKWKEQNPLKEGTVFLSRGRTLHSMFTMIASEYGT